MSIRFNADEVFEMAVHMEENGAAFYRRAAEQHAGDADCAFLLEMAGMEDQHVQIFASMRAELPEDIKAEKSFDPYGEGALYLDAMADAAKAEGAPAITEMLTGSETLANVVEIAISLEKEAILFYLGLKDKVPASLGGDKIDGIIEEEKKHVVMLSRKLKDLRDAQ